MNEKEYIINIDPNILELIGKGLYTNIYYVLAELIANAYDADASNVYIILNENDITVEDDGRGMSYAGGDIKRYLNVAVPTRTTQDDSYTSIKKRKKMGRKGIGKLAALSVSEDVLIKTISKGEKSGFILSRHINGDHLLEALNEDEIFFEKVSGDGTSIVMLSPQNKISNSMNTIKRNLLKIFPMVNNDFKIHIIRGKEEEIIDSFDKEIISELSTLITIGSEFDYLHDFFETPFTDHQNELCVSHPRVSESIHMKDSTGTEKEYNEEIVGWIGTYASTKNRKAEITDFPDNFISLYANDKLGEFNILPIVGQNKLNEVYVVGQLHVDIFELTELPDMALSNRQGYRTDDPRYQILLNYVRNHLLPEALNMRQFYTSLKEEEKNKKKLKTQSDEELSLKKSIDSFKSTTSKNAAQKVASQLDMDKENANKIEKIFSDEINKNSPELGIKPSIDAHKKKILISHTSDDKDLADVIYSMLIFNGVPPEDIIYSSCEDSASRLPEGDNGKSGIYDYLRTFFVDSYSTQKIYVLFVTSHHMRKSWGAVVEVGAAWITQAEHKIFNIEDFRPEHPLDDEQQWHSSFRDPDNNLCMTSLNVDIFSNRIEYICNKLGYSPKKRQDNNDYLSTLVKVSNN